MSRRRAGTLGFAAAGVLLAAADTYVVVVAFPAIMSGVGIPIEQLQRATPIISGYLLGYVAVLPLLGRLADQIGKRPVFLTCLAAFAAGSVVTATSHVLSLLVVGRAVQGLGGGGLVPVTLALVAEAWPPERRGLPLGVIGAVQELGSVLGPLYGAAVVSLAGWRWIFWLNLPLSAAVAAGFVSTRPTQRPAPSAPARSGGSAVAGPSGRGDDSPSRRRPGRQRADLVGAGLVLAAAAAWFLALAAPSSLAEGVTTGRLYAPAVGGPTWSVLTTPLALGGAVLLVAFVVRELRCTHPLVPLARLPSALRDADPLGAALFAGLLSCVVVVFSTSDPERQVVASDAVVLAPLAALLAVALVWRQRHCPAPLLDRAALSARPAWGALVVNLAAGAGLMAALVDVPFFARATVDPGSQLAAASVLLRFLVAVPLGALLGGFLCRRPGVEAPVAAVGLAVAGAAFWAMTAWGPTTLATPLHLAGVTLPFGVSGVELVACGAGFGLAIAPVNAAVLAAVPAERHGLAVSLVVVARTVGMLAGVSALTAVALHRFYRLAAHIPSPLVRCPTHPASCPAYERATTAALLGELHTVFAGAAVAAAAGAALSLLLLRPGSARPERVLSAGGGRTTMSGARRPRTG